MLSIINTTVLYVTYRSTLLPFAHYFYLFVYQWNDREYTKDEWIHNNGNIEAGKLHDGTEIAVSDVVVLRLLPSCGLTVLCHLQLDAAFIKSLIKKAVRNMT